MAGMVKRLLAWFPKLSRRTWIGLGLVYLATLPVLYFMLPIRPTITLHSPEPVVVLGFSDNTQKVVTIGCLLDTYPRIVQLVPPLGTWDLRTGAFSESSNVLHDDVLRYAASAPDGATVALTSESNLVMLYSLTDEKLVFSAPCAENVLQAFSADGTWYVVIATGAEATELPLIVHVRT